MSEMCCASMTKWSAEGETQLIRQTRLGTMMGIRTMTDAHKKNPFISIAFCPWCGTKVSFVDDSLIGMEIGEIRPETKTV